MSGELLQELAAGAIVLGAAAFLVVRRVRRRKAVAAGACPTCPACAAAPATTPRDDWSRLENPQPKLVVRGKRAPKS